jgi:predicted outer membrane protein
MRVTPLRFSAAAMIVAVLAIASLHASPIAQAATSSPTPQHGATATSAISDRQFLEIVIHLDEMDYNAAQLATIHAKHAQLQEFARRLLTEQKKVGDLTDLYEKIYKAPPPSLSPGKLHEAGAEEVSALGQTMVMHHQWLIQMGTTAMKGGGDFDRTFLLYMMQHSEMETLFATSALPSLKRADLQVLATSIIDTLPARTAELWGYYKEWYP